MLVDETPNATIAPGPTASYHGTKRNINNLCVAHAHEGALRKTVKPIVVILVGELHECKGCSIPSIMDNHANKRLSAVVFNVGGKEPCDIYGGNEYPMIDLEGDF